MLRYAVLGSGSSGNSYIFENGDFSFLIDAGFSGRELLRRATDFGFDCKNIRYIFLTHDHTDHTKGGRILAEKLKIPLITNETMWSSGLQTGPKTSPLRGLSGHEELKIIPFPTSHDAPRAVSYTFSFSGTRITIITDTGVITEKMKEYARKSDILFLEANHNIEMLKNGPYPYFLKKRILSSHGHLSNLDAISLLNSFSDPSPQIELFDRSSPALTYFCHLSGTNNSPEQLEEDIRHNLSWRGKWIICEKNLPVYGI